MPNHDRGRLLLRPPVAAELRVEEGPQVGGVCLDLDGLGGGVGVRGRGGPAAAYGVAGVALCVFEEEGEVVYETGG